MLIISSLFIQGCDNNQPDHKDEPAGVSANQSEDAQQQNGDYSLKLHRKIIPMRFHTTFMN